MSTTTITAQVDNNILQMINRISKEKGISLGTIINFKLKDFLQNYQEKMDWEIDFWKEGVPAEEVVKFLQEHID